MLHSSTADPFKLALYKLMGKIDPTRRSVPQVTVTTEDWLWFQLSMVDEEESGGLRGLAGVLLSYGEQHFDGVPGQKGVKRGVWAGVLLMCGQFERVGPHVFCRRAEEILTTLVGRCGIVGPPRDRGRSCSPCNRPCISWSSPCAIKSRNIRRYTL